MWYHGGMTQSEIQTQLKSLETLLERLEKEAKEAIAGAVDAIAKQQVEDVRSKIARIQEGERTV